MNTNKTVDDRIKEYVEFMPKHPYILEDLKDMGFFTAPASTKYHGAYEGGLFDHSLEVAISLVHMTNKLNLKWESPMSPYIVGMFHDLCKVDNYNYNEQEHKFEYNNDTLLKGHGDKSIMLLSAILKLTNEEVACIRYHMGAYDTDLWDYYDRAIRKYPNVLWTHTADMVASKIIGV